jgi:hypothetical protein
MDRDTVRPNYNAVDGERQGDILFSISTLSKLTLPDRLQDFNSRLGSHGGYSIRLHLNRAGQPIVCGHDRKTDRCLKK